MTYTIFWSPIGAQSRAAGSMSDRLRPKRNCCWPNIGRRRLTGAGVALYLDPEVLRRLEHADPHRALTEHNLADYCTALEGVSHFVYSTWRLERDLPVSLLELETQAEVDKYAVTVFFLARQTGAMVYPAQVHARLFDRVRFDARLEPDEYERYRTAHRCAARYCRRLERRFVNRGVAQN